MQKFYAPTSFITTAINLDGDLKANITSEQRDVIWKGQYPGQPNWFAGDVGRSSLRMSYDFSDPQTPSALGDFRFVNASGNRPFAFTSALNGAFPKLYLNETSNIVVHFDIKFNSFSSDRHSWLRTSVVVALQNDNGSDRLYFEQDIKSNALARAALPLHGSDVTEIYYANIKNGKWVHLDVPFEDFIQNTANRPPKAGDFFDSPNSTFVESVYLVNECFGNGHVSYNLANWWITVQQNQTTINA